MNEKDCFYCKHQHTLDCPNSQICYSLENKPYFKLKPIYKSKLICKDKVFYNINHFNRLQKWVGKILFKIKIEDIREE